jgi:hypothetical protein
MLYFRMLTEQGLYCLRYRLAVSAPTGAELQHQEPSGLVDLLARWLIIAIFGSERHADFAAFSRGGPVPRRLEIVQDCSEAAVQAVSLGLAPEL